MIDRAPKTVIRPEAAGDEPGIRRVHLDAFPSADEADLVDRLRGGGWSAKGISLVALSGREIVGHCLTTPAVLRRDDDRPSLPVLGLGPIGVPGGRQRSGVGTVLMRETIRIGRDGDEPGIVLLGHSEYYPRFGFVPASRFAIRCQWDVPDEVWMALESRPGSLAGAGPGLVEYAQPFAAL